MNADLRLAGDGVGSARLDARSKLCAAHPNVKFLVTVLDAAQQHAAAVIACASATSTAGEAGGSLRSRRSQPRARRCASRCGTQFTFAASCGFMTN